MIMQYIILHVSASMAVMRYVITKYFEEGRTEIIIFRDKQDLIMYSDNKIYKDKCS
jgi:hypothetical protein